ncbi:hypothetical protein V1515DRAFT_519809, partial [Lipomyces mesembrius]
LRKVHRAQIDIYKNASQQPDEMSADARMFHPPADDNEAAENAAAAVQRVRDIPTRSDAGYNMIDDDEEIVLDTGRNVLFRDLTDGQIVYCPACETALNRDAGRTGNWVVDGCIGAASASCIERVNGQMVIYCFMQTMKSSGDARKLNSNGRRDSSFDRDYRLFFLDSPMGSGKTYTVREYLRENPGLSVLSVTFRKSLARYLARELNLECYLDDGFWKEDSKDRPSC